MDRFLIIQTAFIGDVILATPVLEKLHAHYPHARIDMLVRQGNEALLHNHPFLNKVHTWIKTANKYTNFIKLIQQIRKERYDCVINLHRFTSSGILAVLARASTTLGFATNPLSFFYTHRASHKIGDGTHEVERNLGVINPLVDTSFTKPRLYPSADDYESVAHYTSSPYICIAPASVWYTKQLPAAKWIALIDQLPSAYAVYLFGGSEDRAMCQTIANRSNGSDNIHILAGELSFLQSAALMEGAVMNYVNDSAPLHLASAVNAPTTAVFCSTVPRFGFGPLSDQSTIVETPIDGLYCRPCGLHGYRACPEEHFRCANSISAEQLLSALDKVKSDNG